MALNQSIDPATGRTTFEHHNSFLFCYGVLSPLYSTFHLSRFLHTEVWMHSLTYVQSTHVRQANRSKLPNVTNTCCSTSTCYKMYPQPGSWLTFYQVAESGSNPLHIMALWRRRSTTHTTPGRMMHHTPVKSEELLQEAWHNFKQHLPLGLAAREQVRHHLHQLAVLRRKRSSPIRLYKDDVV